MTRSQSHLPTAAAEEERASVKSRSRSHSPDAAEQEQDVALVRDRQALWYEPIIFGPDTAPGSRRRK